MADPALEALLLQCSTAVDTAQIKQAEQQIKVLLKRASNVPSFMSQIQHSQHAPVRQMAAVLLRKKINTHWTKLGEDTQIAIKQVLLATVAVDPQPLVRRSLALLISTICKHQVPFGQWNEVLAFVQQCTVQSEEQHRSLGFMLLQFMAETIGTHLKGQLEQLQQVFLSGLQDAQSVHVRVSALKAVVTMLDYLDSDAELLVFRSLIVPMLGVVKQCVETGDDQEAIEVFDTLGEVVQHPAPVITSAAPALIEYLTKLVVDDTGAVEVRLRDSAGMLLNQIVQYKPKTVAKKRLVEPIIAAMLHLCSQTAASPGESVSELEGQYAADTGEEDEDEDDLIRFRIAQSLLDTLALALPGKHVLRPTLAAATPYLADADNPRRRRAALVALGAVTEGCELEAREILPSLLPQVLQVAADADALVRESACFCLQQFAEHLQPEIFEHHEAVLPVIFRLTDDTNTRVRTWSCSVISEYVEHLEPEQVVPHLDPLMQRLVALAQQPNPSVRVSALGAIAATAAGAETQFRPYFEQLMPMLKPLLQLTENEHLDMRGRALDCVGHMGVAVGAEAFEPHLMEVMQFALQGLLLDPKGEMDAMPELKEFTFIFFANVAKLLGERFAPFLSELVPHLLDAVNISDGQIRSIGGSDSDEDSDEDEGAGAGKWVDEDEDEDEEDDDPDNRRSVTVRVRTAMLAVKAGAIEALGFVAENTKGQFAPFVQPVLENVAQQHGYFHEDVRGAVVRTVGKVALAAFHARPFEFEKGAIASLEPLTAAAAGEAMKICAEHMLQDPSKEVVAGAVEAAQQLVEHLGTAALQPVFDTMSKATLKLLREKARCQIVEDEDEEDEDCADHDHLLMDSVADLIGAYAKAMGGAFAPTFQKLLPGLLRFLKGHRPSPDRSMAAGALAEVCDEMGAAAAPFVEPLFEVLMRALADDNINVRRNTAFAVGVLCEHCADATTPRLQDFLRGLRPLFDAGSVAVEGEGIAPGTSARKDDGACLDNACAAVCRMVMAGPERLPLDQVLPVLVGALPLRVDQDEVPTICRCVCGLLQQRNAAMTSLLPQAVQALAAQIARGADGSGPPVDAEISALIGATMTPLCSEHHAQLGPIFGSWPPELQQVAALWMGAAGAGSPTAAATPPISPHG